MKITEMMIEEIKTTIDVDVLGNDSEYINRLDFHAEDYYNIRSMMEAIEASPGALREVALACAIKVYCIQQGKVDDIQLEELLDDIDDHIEEKFGVLNTIALEEYNQLKEDEEEDED